MISDLFFDLFCVKLILPLHTEWSEPAIAYNLRNTPFQWPSHALLTFKKNMYYVNCGHMVLTF